MVHKLHDEKPQITQTQDQNTTKLWMAHQVVYNFKVKKKKAQ